MTNDVEHAAPRPGLGIADLERRARCSLERSARRRAGAARRRAEDEMRWTVGSLAASGFFIAAGATVIAAWISGA